MSDEILPDPTVLLAKVNEVGKAQPDRCNPSSGCVYVDRDGKHCIVGEALFELVPDEDELMSWLAIPARYDSPYIRNSTVIGELYADDERWVDADHHRAIDELTRIQRGADQDNRWGVVIQPDYRSDD